ncbi:MAG: efflux RND transporter periplasmic adaptor subunit [Lentisphaerae bacterium]|nr:efflux RND transporter periplasmic adaptor subunit [Lentisphaerota bacterium]
MKRSYYVGIGLAVALVAGGIWWYVRRDGDGSAAYLTAPLARGEVVEQVHATGVIKPLQLVEVGTQVNGPVDKLMADFNDVVKAGQIVAQIDPAAYEARVAQDQASVVQSEANVEDAQARLKQAELKLTRARELSSRKLIPDADLEAAEADRDVLAAQRRVSEARLVQSRAVLRQSQTSLDYTTIRSPVDGVVIERKVDQGQTVVASMSAQTIFVIAADLHTVQVEANIPEADIGRLKVGQAVTFTVDAYEDTFTGTVHQVRLASANVQNVVTYPVIIRAPNPEDKLLPGMTANLACEVARREQVLKVPNSALRFRPDGATGAESGKGAEAMSAGPIGPRIWVLAAEGGVPEPLTVTLGISDGTATEIMDPAPVEEGRDVIIGYAPGAKRSNEKVNPFTPKFPPRAARRVR